MPKPFPSAADTDAMVERVAPAILGLLADGVPRSKRAVAAALAGRHPKDEVTRTLMRLAVTGRVAEAGGSTAPSRRRGRQANRRSGLELPPVGPGGGRGARCPHPML